MTTHNTIKAVILDVDGVLFDGNSWLVLTEELGCSVEEHAELYKQGKAGNLDWHQAERKLVAMYQTGGKATRDFITNLCAYHALRPEAQNIVEYLKSKEYILCLISGSFDIHVAATAKQLGLKYWYANARLVFDETGYLESIIYNGDQNQVKVNQLEEFCRKVGIKPTDCVFVGDSDNDIGVFQVTKHGIAVHCSDDHLSEIAWKECESLDEIGDIL